MLRRLTLIAIVTMACSESSGPSLQGTPYFTGTVNGQAWMPGLPYSGCADFGLRLSFPIASVIPGKDLLDVQVLNVQGPGTYALGDSATGRYAQTINFNPVGPAHRTHSGNGDRVTITAISFTDSMALGSFNFRLVSDTSASVFYDFTGKFRVPLAAIYTVSHPSGTPCFGGP